jgi:hypothetical protein
MLERELAALLHDVGLAGRQADAVAARLGWDGNGTATLERAAGDHGYSRERVRQLEARVRQHVAGEHPKLPVVEAALDVVEASAPDDRRHVARLLAAEGLAAGSFDPAGVLVASTLVGQRPGVRVEGRIVRLRHGVAPDAALLSAARALAAGHGEVSVDLLARCSGFATDRVRRLLTERDEVQWLGPDRAALGLRSAALDRRVARILPKLLSVARLLSLSEIDDALRRTFNPIVLPLRVLWDVCESIPWLLVDGDRSTVTSLVRFEPQRVLSPIELAIARIFEGRILAGKGPVLSFSQVVELTREEGLNRNSVGVYLTRTPILKTLGRGRYALRGHALGAV